MVTPTHNNCMVFNKKSNDEFCNLLKKMSIPKVCGKHKCYTNPHLCMGSKFMVWPQHSSLRPIFPAHELSLTCKKGTTKLIGNSKPLTDSTLLAARLSDTAAEVHPHTHGPNTRCTNTFFFLWFNKHRLTEKVNLVEPWPGRQGLAHCYYLTGTSHSLKI